MSIPDPASVDQAQLAQLTQQVANILSTQPHLVDREEGEADEGVVFVNTGWVRFRIATPDGSDVTTYRLRRPFFGEIKRFRTKLAALSAEVDESRIELEQMAADLQRRAPVLVNERQKIQTSLEGEAVADAQETARLLARRAEILVEERDMRGAAQEKSRETVALAADLRAQWYRDVFETVCVDDVKVPEDWPAWVEDPDLPARLIEHWRSVPLGRG